MTDDLKQKAHAAWENVGRNDIRAAVSASIAEALAPVLERVARLEELAQFPTLMAENDALLQKMADAPCATCGGARWVCDVSVDGASYHRSPCLDCSKPAASTEGKGCQATRTSASGQLLTCSLPAHSEGLHKSPEGWNWAMPESLQYPSPALQHNPGLGSVTMSTEQAAALLKNPSPAESKGNGLGKWGVYNPNRSKWLIGHGGKPWQGSHVEAHMKVVEVAKHDGPPEWEAHPLAYDPTSANRYHQSLGAKWMCEAIVSKYAPDEREFVHAFARKWEDPSFWRPKTSDTSGGPLMASTVSRDEACTASAVDPSGSTETAGAQGVTAPATAATQGIPQSGPRAPERVERLRVVSVLETRYASASVEITMPSPQGMWPHARGTEFVRADVHAKACVDSRRLGEEHVRLLDERGDFTEGSRPWRCEKELEKARAALASAERRIAELEGANAAIRLLHRR